MFGKTNRATNERLDGIAREIIDRARADDGTIEHVASSGFLYTRVRAKIAAEIELRASNSRLANLIGVAWRAVPAMALSASIAFGVFWFGGSSQGTKADDALFAANEPTDEQVLFADRDALSGDESFEALFGGEPEASAVSGESK